MVQLLTSYYANLWKIKNPPLRAVRLRIMYQDVYSNERRHRFNLADSALCESCGMVESVEHQLYSCQNAERVWDLFRQMTSEAISSFLDVILCNNRPEIEIIKAVLLKALIQIDRSRNKSNSLLIAECVHYLQVEARANCGRTEFILRLVDVINLFR